MNKKAKIFKYIIVGLFIVAFLWAVFVEFNVTGADVPTQSVEPSTVTVCPYSGIPAMKMPEKLGLVEEVPLLHYTVTDEERELLAKVVHEEGNSESLECQKAIVSVIFNRVDGKIFGGDTIEEVVYEKTGGYYQFSVVPLLSRTVPNDTNFEAVDYVIKNGPTVPYYVCFFRSAHYFRNYSDYCNYDNTFFSYNKNHVESLK